MASSVDLGRELEKFVSSLIAKGRYASKSEVLREGLRLLQVREMRLATLDDALDRGLGAAHLGRVRPAEEVFSRLEAKYRKMAKSKV
jgi:antitoxin ParD1/3/4